MDINLLKNRLTLILIPIIIIFLLHINWALSSQSGIIPTPTSTLYLELILNGINTGKIIWVNFKDGHYYIRLKELKSVGLIIPKYVKITHPIAIDKIKNIHVKYDVILQRLLIDVPYFWFPKHKIFLSHHKNVLQTDIQSKSNFGWLFNYNLYFRKKLSSYNKIGLLRFWSEVRIFSKFAVLSNTGIWSNEPYINYIRYDTHLDINDERHLVSYIIGDTTTDSLWGSDPIRIGGIKFFRNFSLYPDMITYPLPEFEGHIVKPSIVNLYINHSKIISTKINPGSFILKDAIPNIQGASQAKIVTLYQDPNNASSIMKKVNIIPFYVSSELLKQGLTNFSLSLGLLRKNYGINSMDYTSNLITSGIIRHGVKSWLTLEGKMEASRDLDWFNYGVGANLKPMRLGVINLSWTGSSMTNHNNTNVCHKSSSFFISNCIGQKITIGYNYNNAYLGLSALHSFSNYNSSNLFHQEFSKYHRHENNLTGSINFGNYGNLSLTLINIWNNKDNTNRFINLSYSITLPKRINLWASINRKGKNHGYNAQLMLNLPIIFSDNASFSSNFDKNDHTSFRQIWSNKIINDNGEIAWNLILSQKGKNNKYHEANIFWKNRYFENRFGIFGNLYHDENAWIELDGSIVNMARHIYVAPPISDAFALVSTKGYSEIPVFYENQLVGKTNTLGYLLVPTVTGWYHSKFDLDPLKLPMDVIATETTKQISVREHSGYLVEFEIHKLYAALFHVVDDKDNFLPNGSRVQIKGTSIVTWLGWDGEVWLEGIKKSNDIIITRSDNGKTCHVKLNIKQFRGISDLGKQVCQ
ncbi:MAG: fimbria/pilus outer membrane usher protein [Candidatus Dasytiphilus stammeri]